MSLTLRRTAATTIALTSALALAPSPAEATRAPATTTAASSRAASSCEWIDWVRWPVQHGARMTVYVRWHQARGCTRTKIRVRLQGMRRGVWYTLGQRVISTYNPGPATYARTVTWPCPWHRYYRAQAEIYGTGDWMLSGESTTGYERRC